MRTLARVASKVLVPLAVVAAVVGAVGVGPAAATNDWTPGSVISSSYRTASSTIYGSHTDIGIFWKGYQVSVNGSVKDTAKDGRSAVVQIRYQVYYFGSWHTHYRYMATASGKGRTAIVYSQRSRYPARAAYARACLSNNGTVVTCDPRWR